ncbi:sulfur reduction protein DsrJ [Thioalkalivibrio nitratireducens]|uniref:sulfur reduction protein DsrJ n=1 Tax=Thioalkalivibrio nitratireducens TaxID=186931 RepID=UPI001F39BFA6|nr:sulfur reduction protein DsrJ [Thioalkalivibrio nitratireducens]
MRRRFTPFGLPLPALVLAGLALTLAACGKVEVPAPELLAEARGDQCVEDTDVMRRDHMKILMHERDEAKRFGRRNPDHSFVGCIDCHVSPTASRDDPSTHFCLACHQFNAVKMDCFQCHTDRPSDSAPMPRQSADADGLLEGHLAAQDAGGPLSVQEISTP